MYTENELEISNKSYTNKDFATIYPELLDLVKKLTNKWDPTTSNESDPGVVLLKLAALIADKNNYNIDKNVLETFPLSVTQLANARKLYDMLGYNMNWYKAADTQVSFTYTGNAFKQSTENTDPVSRITIPQWTMITDDSSSVIYTLKESVTISEKGVSVFGKAIQGTIKDYVVNGVKDITLDNLDSDLRLFFNEKYIAENGIFITNKGFNQITHDGFWTKVDNLESAELGKTVFKFGVLPNSDTCYILFPQDIGSLILNGLNIRYIITKGSGGNINANTLTTLYESLTPSEFNESDSLRGTTINKDISIQNVYAATNGADPEDIDSAYNNYKKTVGTFNTLVTLRDYENAIYLYKDDFDNPLVSNVVVSDRTCDINNTTNVIQKTVNGTEIVSLVNLVDSGLYKKVVTDGVENFVLDTEDSMTAFDLGLYILDGVNSDISNDYYYNKTFSVSNDQNLVKLYLEDSKCIKHEYIDTVKDSLADYLYKAFYKLQGKVLTYYKVTKVQAQEIENNIRLALYKKYNARNVNFGEPVNYDDIVKVIQDSDTRIKTVVLAEPEYYLRRMLPTDATGLYDDSRSFFDESYTDNEIPVLVKFLGKMVLAGNVQLYKFNQDIAFKFGQTEIKKYSNILKISSGKTIELSTTEGVNNVYTDAYKLKDNENILLFAPNLYTKTSYTSYVNYELIDSSSYVNIPLTSVDNKPSNIKECWTFNIQESQCTIVITDSNKVILIDAAKNEYELKSKTSALNSTTLEYFTLALDYKFKLSFVKKADGTIEPQLQCKKIFSIPQNCYYKLKDGESILLNYTTADNIPEFKELAAGTIVKFSDASDPSSVLLMTLSTLVKNYKNATHNFSTLTASQLIDEVAINTVDFEGKTSIPCMWFTNTKETIVTTSALGTKTKYVLFGAGQTERILEDNEYFIYTNQERNELVILGSGTLLSRKGSNLGKVAHEVSIASSEIISSGHRATTDDDWYSYIMSQNGPLSITELLIVTLGKGAGFRAKSVGTDNIISEVPKIVRNAQYCEKYDVDKEDNSLAWKDLVVYDIADGYNWKVYSKLNLTFGSDYPQYIGKGDNISISVPSETTPQSGDVVGYVSWEQGNSIWQVDLTKRDPSLNTYEFQLEGSTYLFEHEGAQDSTLKGTITSESQSGETSVDVSEAGQFDLSDVSYYIDMFVSEDYINYDYRNLVQLELEEGSYVLSNAVVGAAGGSNLELTSSTDAQIDFYTYKETPLPSVTMSDGTTLKLFTNDNQEIPISLKFFCEYTAINLDKDGVILPFSYEGRFVTGLLHNKVKKFIVPVVLHSLNTASVEVSAIGSNVTVELTKENPVSYIEFELRESKPFEGISVKNWKFDTTKSKRYKLSEDETFIVNGLTYKVISVGTKSAVIQQVLDSMGNNISNSDEINLTIDQYFKLGSDWQLLEYKDSDMYIVTVGVIDSLTIGKIHVIEGTEIFSDQVSKTLDILADGYQTSKNNLENKLVNYVTDPDLNFDKTYVVPETDMIDTQTTNDEDTDYLFSSVAVFDSNHIMNKYLIPQLITGPETSITVASQSISK